MGAQDVRTQPASSSPSPQNAWADNPAIDARLGSALGAVPTFAFPEASDIAEFVDQLGQPEYVAILETIEQVFAALDNEEAAPSTGLRRTVVSYRAEPDGNTVTTFVTRPDDDELRTCVLYLHGGAAGPVSADWGQYRALARLMAAHGVAVVMPEIRNLFHSTPTAEAASWPSLVHDAASALRWLGTEGADEVGVDPSRIVVAGESSGGLTAIWVGVLAARGEIASPAGVYALSPGPLSSTYPDPRFPSTIENAGIVLDLTTEGMASGRAPREDVPPLLLTDVADLAESDVAAFPPTIVTVNEFDPLRDEGLAFYRLLLRAGVDARCTQHMGTIHVAELTGAIPELTREVAASVARFAHEQEV